MAEDIFRRSKRDLPVLTELAFKIAPCRGYGKGSGPGEHVKEGLFFDRVQVNGAGIPIDQAEKSTAPILPHPAISPLPDGYMTASRTKKAKRVTPLEGFKIV